MGEHWPHAMKVRGIWPKGTRLADLPDLWADPELGPTRRAWFESYIRAVGECEEWMGARSTEGPGRLPYGYITLGGKSFSAHRVAYTFHHGEDPAALQVCHRCDNPPCTKKAHLFLGTVTDNIRDMLAKGRGNPPQGERMPHAVLTESDVRQMRQLYATGMGVRPIAHQFSVARMTAKYAIFGTTWAHVDEPIPEPRAAGPFGEAHENAKMTDEKVQEMRRLFAKEGWSKRQLGREFGMDPHTVRDILSGKTWGHVKDEEEAG